jgi:prepilin-type processing-associated H-X9-DG protein
LAAAKIKAFQCPADGRRDGAVNGVFAYMNQYGNSYQSQAFGTAASATVGRTNYVGISGAHGGGAGISTNSATDGPGANLTRYEGLLFNRSRVSLGEVASADGTSNTLMFGETLGGSTFGNSSGALAWMASGGMGTKFGLGRPGLPGEPPDSTTQGADHTRLSSYHAGGVQFSMADGSVRSVRFGATCQRNPASRDWWLLQQLAGRKDGLVEDTSQLTD